MINGIKEVLKKLFDKGFIDKEQKEKSDYDLLIEIIRKKEENESKLNKLKSKNIQLEAFYDIISSEDHNYSTNEVQMILDNILE